MFLLGLFRDYPTLWMFPPNGLIWLAGASLRPEKVSWGVWRSVPVDPWDCRVSGCRLPEGFCSWAAGSDGLSPPVHTERPPPPGSGPLVPLG